MRKHVLVAASALAISTAGAFAADLPAREPAPAPAPISTAPIFTWTGFYVGANAGGAWQGGTAIVPGGAFLAPGAAGALPGVGVFQRNNDRVAFTGGLTIGYNWQTGPLVLGVEGDLNLMTGDNKNRQFRRNGIAALPFGAGVAPYGLLYSSSKNGAFFGTARLRAGYAVDRALFYVTGGLAFRDNQSSTGLVVFRDAAGARVGRFAGTSNNSNNIGYAVGGGIEYAISNNWSIKGEYLYAGFGKKSRTLTDPVNAPGFFYTAKNQNHLSIGRVGLNYRF